MSDTFPGTSTTGLANGATIQLNNVDASANITLSAGTGTTLNGASSATIPPNRSTKWVYEAPNTTWRTTMNSLSGVNGPASSTDGNIAIFSGTLGNLLKDPGKPIASGTWTPQLTFGGNFAGMTLSTASGFYQRVDKLVVCSFFVVVSAKGTSTGGASITGLPFTASSNGGMARLYYYSGMSGMTTDMSAVAASTSRIDFYGGTATTVVLLTDANFTSSSVLAGQAFYVLP
jgi:hypothetical protein